MHNLAYKFEATYETVAARSEPNNHEHNSTCAACGEKLFGDSAPDLLWRAWSAFWEISGTNSVELLCGACGEYLVQFFND